MKIRFFVLCFTLALTLARSAVGAVETYVADPAHSSVSFTVRLFVAKVSGRFTKFSATLTVDRVKPETSAAEATIEIASVNTEKPERDAHLQKSEFFEAAKFPVISFKSTSWKKTGADTFDVTGNLTIKGVTKEIVLKVKSLGPTPGASRSAWDGATTIHRSDFGVSGYPKIIGDDVEVTIHLEAAPKI